MRVGGQAAIAVDNGVVPAPRVADQLACCLGDRPDITRADAPSASF